MSDAFLQGFAVALADLSRLHDQPTMVVDVMHGHGLELADFRKAGVDSYDLDEIRKCVEQCGPAQKSRVRRTKNPVV